MIGENFGSGAGMGGVFLNEKFGFNSEKKITLSLKAHEGSIIAVRTYGWHKFQKINEF